jgi:hypothetical protein
MPSVTMTTRAWIYGETAFCSAERERDKARRGFHRAGWLLSLLLSMALVATAQTSVLTQHNDNLRTGQNTNETILNASNVTMAQFGKLFALPVIGRVYAQPLYVSNVPVAGGAHNVLIVATEADLVYAFDADSSAALWRASLVDSAHGAVAGETPLNAPSTTGCTDLQPQIGISSTPVIDANSKTIYVEAKSTINGTSYIHRIHALDLLTGNEKLPGPAVIAAEVRDTDDGNAPKAGMLRFDDWHQRSGPGLLLVNGTIFVAFTSECDSAPNHGWLFAYDTRTFSQKGVFNSTQNGWLGGFWMSGSGIAADASNNLFFAAGQEAFDARDVPPTELSDSVLKFGNGNGDRTFQDHFAPFNHDSRNSGDTDPASGGVLLLPDQLGRFPHVLVQAGKEGRIYFINRDQMTAKSGPPAREKSLCSGCSNDPEIIAESNPGTVGGVWSMPAFWNDTLYFWGSGDVLKSIPVTNGVPDFAHMTSGSVSYAFPGATPSISSNGTRAGTAIVWAIDSFQYESPERGPGPAVVHAADATDIAKELWNSSQAANNRDRAGNAVKFAVPTIANGKVYVPTSTEVDVYGLLNGRVQAATPTINPPGSLTEMQPVQVTITETTTGNPIFYTIDGTTPTAHSKAYTGPITVGSTTTVNAITTAPNFVDSAVASQTYTFPSMTPTPSLNPASGVAQQVSPHGFSGAAGREKTQQLASTGLSLTVDPGCGTASGTLFNLEGSFNPVPQNEPPVDFLYNRIPASLGGNRDLIVQHGNDWRGLGFVPQSETTAIYVHRSDSTACGPDFEMGNAPIGPFRSAFDPQVVADANNDQFLFTDVRFGPGTGVGLRRIAAANLLNTSVCPNGTLSISQANTCSGPAAVVIDQSNNTADWTGLAQDPRQVGSGTGSGDIYVVNISQIPHSTQSIHLTACKALFTSLSDCSQTISIDTANQVNAPRVSVVPAGPNQGIITITYNVYDNTSSGCSTGSPFCNDIKFVVCTPNGAPAPPSCAASTLVAVEHNPVYSIAGGRFPVYTVPVHANRADGSTGQTTFVVWTRCKVDATAYPFSGDDCPDADILMAWSKNLGSTWTQTALETIIRHQFQPAIAVDASTGITDIVYNQTVDYYNSIDLVILVQIPAGSTSGVQAIYVTRFGNNASADPHLQVSQLYGDYMGIAVKGTGMPGGSRAYVGHTKNARLGTYVQPGVTAPDLNNHVSLVIY